MHSTGYCQAVEKAGKIEVPTRARYIRTIVLELERVHSHLLWLGIAGHILGFDTVLMQAWRVREPVMWLCEKITGNRKQYGMNIVGGVRRDIPKEMQKLRLTQKPGCIPPYVSLNRSGNVMSVLQAEKEYLEEKIRNPYTTDLKFFFKALFNIIFRHKRSA